MVISTQCEGFCPRFESTRWRLLVHRVYCLTIELLYNRYSTLYYNKSSKVLRTYTPSSSCFIIVRRQIIHAEIRSTLAVELYLFDRRPTVAKLRDLMAESTAINGGFARRPPNCVRVALPPAGRLKSFHRHIARAPRNIGHK